MLKNTRRLFSIHLLFLLLLGFSVIAQAKQIPPRPTPPKLVNDFTNTFSTAEKNALERKLVAYDDSTSNQIAIVIENSLEGEDIFGYSFRLAQEWGIGREGRNNGILVYVAKSDRRIFIHVGPGLQGVVTDGMTKRVINNVIVPAFRTGDFYQGLSRSSDVLMEMASGEFKNDLPNRRGANEKRFPWEFIILIAIVILILYFNRNDGGGFDGGGRYERPRRRGGGWIIFGDPWSGGGGGFSGGGGFGGFGGGGFDGGGAGGSW